MEKLIGLLLPALIDIVNSKIQNEKVRFWVSVFICFLIATAMDLLLGKKMTPDSLAIDVMALFGIAQISYKAIWENSDVRNSTGLNARTNGTIIPIEPK